MGVRITHALTQDELYKLYTYISQKASGSEVPFIRSEIKKLAWSIFNNDEPLPIFQRSFYEFWKIEGYRKKDLIDKSVYFSIDKSFRYTEKQEPIELSFVNHAIYQRKQKLYESPLIKPFKTFLSLVDSNNFVVIFGAGADTPIPSTDSFQEARDSKDVERVRWNYLDFAVKFFSPIFYGGQVLSNWLLNTNVKIVTTNWSRSVERELVRKRKYSSKVMRKQIDSCLKRVIPYYSNSITFTNKKVRINLGYSKSPTKDKADKIITHADGLLIVGSSLTDESLQSWVISYKETKKPENIKIAMIIHNDRKFIIKPPWIKFLEECDRLLQYAPVTNTPISFC